MGLDDKIKNAAQDIAGKAKEAIGNATDNDKLCLLYTSPSPRDRQKSRMPSSA